MGSKGNTINLNDEQRERLTNILIKADEVVDCLKTLAHMSDEERRDGIYVSVGQESSTMVPTSCGQRALLGALDSLITEAAQLGVALDLKISDP